METELLNKQEITKQINQYFDTENYRAAIEALEIEIKINPMDEIGKVK
jgi:hypothetical protein